jgi:DNA uptake protein ComE-like DNA-binding protein
MASQANIIKRRADAFNSIEASVSALAKQNGLSFEASATRTKDAEYNLLLRLESLAVFLATVAEGKTEAVEGKTEVEATPEDETDEETLYAEYPEGFPYTDILEPQIDYLHVLTKTEKELIGLNDIGKARAKEIAEYIAKNK